MKIKMLDIIVSKDSLVKFRDIENLPNKIKFRIGTMIRLDYNGIMEQFESQKNDLIKKYGEEKEDGSFQVMPSKMNLFQNELNSILSEEVELKVPVIKISEVEECSSISVGMFQDLYWIFTDDSTEEYK